MISFSQPLFLLLLVLVPISAFIALPRLVKRQKPDARARLPLWRRLNRRALGGLLVRSALIASVVLALAGMQAVQYTNKLAVVFLIDASDSVGPAGVESATQFVRDALRVMRPDGHDSAGVIVFGADAQVERAMSDMRDLAPIGTQVRSAGTNIEGAIRLGMSLFPADAARRLVLLSDGKQTVGDAESAARLVQATNGRLDTVALPSVQGADAAIERVDAPQRASVGQVIPLQIMVRSNQPMRAQLTVFAGPDIVAQQDVNLVSGQNEFSVRANATRAGFSEAQAALLLTVMSVGSMAFQIPLGLLSDRMRDRRSLLTIMAAIGLAGSLSLPLISYNWLLMAGVLLVWGGCVAGLYTVGLSHLGSRLVGADLAAANAAFIFCYAVGTVVGPQVIGAAMDVSGNDGFAWAIVAFFGFYLVLSLGRMVFRPKRG